MNYRAIAATHYTTSTLRIITGIFFMPWGFFGILGAHPAGGIAGFHRISLVPLFFFGLLALIPTGRIRRAISSKIYLTTSVLLTIPFLMYVLLEEFRYWGLISYLCLIVAFLTAPVSLFTARRLHQAREQQNVG